MLSIHHSSQGASYKLGKKFRNEAGLLAFVPDLVNRKILFGTILVLVAAPLTVWATDSPQQNNEEQAPESSLGSSLNDSLPSSSDSESIIISNTDESSKNEIKHESSTSITVEGETKSEASISSNGAAAPDLTVNGQQIEVPDNGRLDKTIRDEDSTTRLRIRSNSDSQSNNSNFNIQIDSN